MRLKNYAKTKTEELSEYVDKLTGDKKWKERLMAPVVKVRDRSCSVRNNTFHQHIVYDSPNPLPVHVQQIIKGAFKKPSNETTSTRALAKHILQTSTKKKSDAISKLLKVDAEQQKRYFDMFFPGWEENQL